VKIGNLNKKPWLLGRFIFFTQSLGRVRLGNSDGCWSNSSENGNRYGVCLASLLTRRRNKIDFDSSCRNIIENLSETTLNYERKIKSKPEACKEDIARRGESFSSFGYW